MKQGLLVVNSFFRSKSFDAVQNLLLTAFAKQNVRLDVVGNAELMPILGEKEGPVCDFVLFWCKDTPLAAALENRGIRVFNSSEAIRLCDDKGLTHLALEAAGIPQPKTVLAPHTYENIGYPEYDYLSSVAEKLGFPMVVKERFGSFGQQVYLVQNRAELEEKCRKLGAIKHLYQEFIPSLHQGKPSDLRICVVGDQVKAAIRRCSSGDFRANLEEGGKAEAITPKKEAVELAIRATKALGLDFAGVDLLETAQGEYLVCEVNSNFFFAGLAAATGIDPAAEICAYILGQL